MSVEVHPKVTPWKAPKRLVFLRASNAKDLSENRRFEKISLNLLLTKIVLERSIQNRKSISFDKKEHAPTFLSQQTVSLENGRIVVSAGPARR